MHLTGKLRLKLQRAVLAAPHAESSITKEMQAVHSSSLMCANVEFDTVRSGSHLVLVILVLKSSPSIPPVFISIENDQIEK